MAEQTAMWRQDGIDPGWFYAEGIESVRSGKSYNRPPYDYLTTMRLIASSPSERQTNSRAASRGKV